MSDTELHVSVESETGTRDLSFPVRRLICAGWVGRDGEALQAHIDELARHGVPPPSRTPIFLNFAPYLVTTHDIVDVVSPESSGEVEYVVLKRREEMYVGVGSDHTDRGFEKYSIPASKQMYSKVMAPVVWPYEEVAGHWDQLVIRSWTSTDDQRTLYQDETLGGILDVGELLDQLPRDDGLPVDGFVLYSGTPATKTGLIYGDAFEFEMEDPVLRRTIRHGYRIRVLPQYQ